MKLRQFCHHHQRHARKVEPKVHRIVTSVHRGQEKPEWMRKGKRTERCAAWLGLMFRAQASLGEKTAAWRGVQSWPFAVALDLQDDREQDEIFPGEGKIVFSSNL